MKLALLVTAILPVFIGVTVLAQTGGNDADLPYPELLATPASTPAPRSTATSPPILPPPLNPPARSLRSSAIDSAAKPAAPRWLMAKVYEIDPDQAISLIWAPVAGADGYEVKIKNMDRDYEPSSHFIEKSETRARLNPGQFEFRVATVSGGKLSDEAKVQVTLRRKRAFQIDRVDFMARYSYTKFEYDTYTYETGTGIADSFYDGGVIAFRSDFWILDSKWGFRLGGLWGGFNYNDQTIALSDFSLEAAYRVENKGGLFAPYFGFREWTMPIIRLSNPNLEQSSFRIFTPSLFGAALGADTVLPLGGLFTLEGNAEISVPLIDSSIGDDFLAQKNPLPIVGGKVSAAFAYAVSAGLKTFVGAEYTQDIFQWPVGPSNSRVETATISGLVGLATKEDSGNEFRQSHFAEVQLESKLSYSPYFYDAVIDEAKNVLYPNFFPETTFQADGGSTLAIGATGWFRNSLLGLRATGAVADFSYLGVTYSFFQFEGQLGLQLVDSGGFKLNEFFGGRAWTVPVIYNSATSSNYRSEDPTLMGFAETLAVEQKWGRFKVGALGEVSAPLGALDKDSYVTQILPQALSYRGEMSVTYDLTRYLAAGVSGAYLLDQYRYIAGKRSQDRSSTATLSCNELSVTAHYNF